MALNDAEFLQQLDQAFGYRLGKFTKVGKRSSYPLSLVTSDKNTANRTIIIGNASHTLHPVAGQGLNLALRDVAHGRRAHCLLDTACALEQFRTRLRQRIALR